MSFTVTATFATAQEAAHFLAGTSADHTSGTGTPEKAVAAVIAKASQAEKPKAEKAAAPAASAAPAPTTVPAPAVDAKPKADSGVDYPTLQKAVFKLAGISRDEAGAAAKTFGVNTFKELPADKWGEALAAVEAKIDELTSAVA